MNDYIMNRESLKRHCESMCKKFKDVPTSGTYGEHRLVLDLLEQTEWIPVSERLPEDFQRVLVTVVNYNGNKVVRVAEYDNYKGVFRIKENHEEWEVGEKGLLAWMSLPEPYKEGEKE